MFPRACAILFAVSALTARGDRIYNSKAELDHLPIAIMSLSLKPNFPSIVVMPILKECEDILPIDL